MPWIATRSSGSKLCSGSAALALTQGLFEQIEDALDSEYYSVLASALMRIVYVSLVGSALSISKLLDRLICGAGFVQHLQNDAASFHCGLE